MSRTHTPHTCRCHGETYTTCELCFSEYCPHTWTRCPRTSWHHAHVADTEARILTFTAEIRARAMRTARQTEPADGPFTTR